MIVRDNRINSSSKTKYLQIIGLKKDSLLRLQTVEEREMRMRLL